MILLFILLTACANQKLTNHTPKCVVQDETAEYIAGIKTQIRDVKHLTELLKDASNDLGALKAFLKQGELTLQNGNFAYESAFVLSSLESDKETFDILRSRYTSPYSKEIKDWTLEENRVPFLKDLIKGAGTRVLHGQTLVALFKLDNDNIKALLSEIALLDHNLNERGTILPLVQALKPADDTNKFLYQFTNTMMSNRRKSPIAESDEADDYSKPSSILFYLSRFQAKISVEQYQYLEFAWCTTSVETTMTFKNMNTETQIDVFDTDGAAIGQKSVAEVLMTLLVSSNPHHVHISKALKQLRKSLRLNYKSIDPAIWKHILKSMDPNANIDIDNTGILNNIRAIVAKIVVDRMKKAHQHVGSPQPNRNNTGLAGIVLAEYGFWFDNPIQVASTIREVSAQ